MTRVVLIGLGAFLIIISLWGLYAPASEVESFLTLKQNFETARLAAGVFMLFYGCIESFRLPFMRFLIGMAGVIALLGGILGLFLWYLLPMDIFILLTGGIYAILANIELETVPLPSMPFRLAIRPRVSAPNLTKSVNNLLTHTKPTFPQSQL